MSQTPTKTSKCAVKGLQIDELVRTVGVQRVQTYASISVAGLVLLLCWRV